MNDGSTISSKAYATIGNHVRARTDFSTSHNPRHDFGLGLAIFTCCAEGVESHVKIAIR